LYSNRLLTRNAAGSRRCRRRTEASGQRAKQTRDVGPELDGLRIDPCIPSSWPGFTAERIYRGKRIRIEVRNPDHVCRGVRSMTLNGEPTEGNLLAAEMLREENEVVVSLSSSRAIG